MSCRSVSRVEVGWRAESESSSNNLESICEQGRSRAASNVGSSSDNIESNGEQCQDEQRTASDRAANKVGSICERSRSRTADNVQSSGEKYRVERRQGRVEQRLETRRRERNIREVQWPKLVLADVVATVESLS
uniref:Uncharacterized protein n=1 Tax=Plectus sambesii TaxID=2011161 RepID=A0A914UYR8_9BILA